MHRRAADRVGGSGCCRDCSGGFVARGQSVTGSGFRMWSPGNWRRRLAPGNWRRRLAPGNWRPATNVPPPPGRDLAQPFRASVCAQNNKGPVSTPGRSSRSSRTRWIIPAGAWRGTKWPARLNPKPDGRPWRRCQGWEIARLVFSAHTPAGVGPHARAQRSRPRRRTTTQLGGRRRDGGGLGAAATDEPGQRPTTTIPLGKLVNV